MVTQKCEIATFCEMVRNSFPNNLGKTASPVLVPLYYDFAELRIRHENENLQLNIDYIREPLLALFWRSYLSECCLLTYQN